jgi:CRP-like cAMP-binding protein
MIDHDLFSEYYPFNKLDPVFVPLLLEQMEFCQLESGDVLFNAGDNPSLAYYLINGQLLCEYPDGRQRTIRSTSLQSRYPVGDLNPNKRFRASVSSPSASTMTIDSTLLDHFTVWNEVHENAPTDSPLRGHDDYRWVLGLLSNRVVKMLPRGHVHELFSGLSARPVKAGEEIIAEGDPGDACYVIAQGQATVFKCAADGESQVADLQAGDLFGENALVSNEPRSASVRMVSDGLLMQLDGQDFAALLKSHVVRWLNPQDVTEMLASGAELLDVRPPGELDSLDCLNIPLEKIREMADQIPKDRPVIACCDDGQRSASAAYILATLGHDVYALQGGVRGLLRNL